MRRLTVKYAGKRRRMTYNTCTGELDDARYIYISASYVHRTSLIQKIVHEHNGVQVLVDFPFSIPLYDMVGSHRDGCFSIRFFKLTIWWSSTNELVPRMDVNWKCTSLLLLIPFSRIMRQAHVNWMKNLRTSGIELSTLRENNWT